MVKPDSRSGGEGGESGTETDARRVGNLADGVGGESGTETDARRTGKLGE